MSDRSSIRLRPAGPALALTAMALGALMPAWGWAAEAHEPSRAGGAPSALAVSVFATASFGIAAPVPTAVSATVLASSEGTVVRRPWGRGRPPGPPPVAPVYARLREPSGWVTLRGGFFDVDQTSSDEWLAGFKLTGRVGDAFHLGVSTDWQYRSESAYGLVDRYIGPGGVPVDVFATQYETHSYLIPIMAVAEARPILGPVSPYFGAGVGYEVLVVDVHDYVNGVRYEDDFGGFGWQPYVGLAVSLGRGAQLVGEGYGNFSTVSRTVRDLGTGYLVEEKIDASGVGMRAGLAFGF